MKKLTTDIPHRVAQSVLLRAKPEIEGIVYLCTVPEPADIRGVGFRRGEVKIDLRWPFDCPLPTGNADGPLGTRRAVDRFRRELRAYFLEQRAGNQLANIFHGQFVDFLPRFLGLTPFARLPGKEGTVQDALASMARRTKARRLAGPRKIILPDAIVSRMKRESPAIVQTILKIQQRLVSWLAQDPQASDVALRERINEEFDRETYPWMRHFTRAFRLLEVKKTRKADRLRPSLSYPKQWSALTLARLIVKEKLQYETGIEYPVSKLARIVELPIRRRTK